MAFGTKKSTPTRSLTGNATSAQNSAVYVMNWKRGDFKATVRLDTDGSTTGATLQYTLDYPWGTYSTDFPTDATWVAHGDANGITSDTTVNFNFPVTAVRLQVDDQGTDTWTATILQPHS